MADNQAPSQVSLVVSSSPHFHSGQSTQRIMLDVCIALLPACAWGCYQWGLRALIVMLISILSCLGSEYLLCLSCGKKNTLGDLSALVTGLLVGMNMSPTVPFYVPLIAGMFAIGVAKFSFGGLGQNWVNPAIAGRVFVFYSFTKEMNTFALPRTLVRAAKAVDAISGATPLTLIGTAAPAAQTGTQILSSAGLPTTALGVKIAGFLHTSPYVADAFLGNISGCIGEGSAALLLLGAAYLFIRRVITWHIPLSFLASWAVLGYIFGGIPQGLGFFRGEQLLPLFSGGLMLGAFFMATDMVTTPVTRPGQVIFGIGCGAFTMLLRTFGAVSEGTSLAIMLMNIATPTIDKFCRGHIYGVAKKKAKGGK